MSDVNQSRVFRPRTIFLLGVAGVLMLALSARTGVAALSPLAGEVDLDVPLDGLALGILGTIPPVAYGIAGWLTRFLALRFSLERLAIVVGLLAAVGHTLRGVMPTFVGLFVATVVLMLAVVVTNVLMPALVKIYAPHRSGPVTSAYSTLMAISTSAPALAGVWIADAVGWRWSIASWAILSALAVIPWIILIPTVRKRRAEEQVALVETGPISTESPLWRAPSARIMALMFGLSAFVAYSVFAVLPAILIDVAGFTRNEAGFALFVWSMMGVPLSLVIPLFAVRDRWPGRLAVVSAIAGASGFLGLLIAPTLAPIVWTMLTAVATLNFPLILTLIPDRTDNHRTATQLGGLVNTFGYLVGSLGPIVGGVVYSLTGSWLPALGLLAGVVLLNLLAYPVLRHRRSVNEEMRHAHIRLNAGK